MQKQVILLLLKFESTYLVQAMQEYIQEYILEYIHTHIHRYRHTDTHTDRQTGRHACMQTNLPNSQSYSIPGLLSLSLGMCLQT